MSQYCRDGKITVVSAGVSVARAIGTAPLAVSELEAWRQRRTTNTIPNATTKEGPFSNTEQRKTCFLAPKLLAVPFDLVLSFVHELLIRVHYSSHTYQLSVVAKM